MQICLMGENSLKTGYDNKAFFKVWEGANDGEVGHRGEPDLQAGHLHLQESHLRRQIDP